MRKTIGIIGFGNMGSAFYYGLREANPNLDFLIYDRNLIKLDRLPSAHRSHNIDQLVRNSHYVILAIKPQSFNDFAAAYRGTFDDQVVISIMAGLSVDHIGKNLMVDRVVRCMPNLPVKVKNGVIGWVANEVVSSEQKNFLSSQFAHLGYSLELDTEPQLADLTVIAGCGPGYFYYFADLLAQKAIQLGFSAQEAQKLVRYTFKGSADLLSSDESLANRVSKVASKGGVTEAAIQSFEDQKLTDLISQAIDKAKQRDEELNK